MNYLGSTKSLANLPEAGGYILQQRDTDLMEAIRTAHESNGGQYSPCAAYVTGAVIKVGNAEISEVWLSFSHSPYNLEAQYTCFFQAQ